MLITVSTRVCHGQTFFPCGTNDSDNQIDPTFVPWALHEYQDVQQFSLREEPDIIIPLAILLVDPLPEWDYIDLQELLSNSLKSFRDEWYPYDLSFNVGVVEEITNAQLSSKYLHYREDMHVLVVVNATSTEVTLGSCGSYAYWYPNRVAIRFASSCASHVDDGKAFGFVHEFAHNLDLDHTFYPGNGGSDYDVYTVMRPDGSTFYNINPFDTTLTAGVDFVGDSIECEIRGDRFCSTLTEINPGDREMWYDNGIQFYVRHPLPYDSLQIGKNIYTPNYEIIPWYNDKTAVSYVQDSNGNDIELPPCSLAAINLRDWRGNLYKDVFSEKGYYNIMSYGGEACPAHFEPEQLDSMNARINRPNSPTPIVQDVITRLVITEDGNSDTYDNTFSSLDDACTFIQNHWMNKYIIYIESDSSNVGDVTICSDHYQGDNIVPGLYDNIVQRYIYIQIIGVESVEVDGSNPVERDCTKSIITQMNTCYPLTFIGNIDLQIKNIEFDGFGNGRQFGHNGASGVVIDFKGSRLELNNCEFYQNGLNSSRETSLDVCKGVVHFDPIVEPDLIIKNCVFADNRSPGGPAIALCMDNVDNAPQNFATITQTTFANNFFLQSTPQNGVMHVETMGSVLLRNCVFSGSDPLHGTPGNQPAIAVEIGAPREMNATIENCLFDQEQWVVNGLPGLDPSNVVIHHDSTPGFTNPSLQDYRLKWNSVCMDVGSSLEPMNFDLTQSDIGWSPVYPVMDITGNQTGPMELGWYRILSNAILSAEDLVIPAGTVLRFDSGVSASFRAQGAFSGGYNITIGDLNGPRTALVAKDSNNPQDLPCSHYGFGTNATSPYLANVEFNGVLFNYAPSLGMGFNRSNVDFDGENIVAIDFDNVGLSFGSCDGQVTHFSEATGCGPRLGWVDQMTSAVDVSYVDFPPQTEAFFCNLFNSGTYAGQTILQHNNGFTGNDPEHLEDYDNIPVLLFDCTVRQHHNQYVELAAGGVYMADATLHMNNGAMNRFLRIPGYTPTTAMIQGYDAAALINVKCGYNSFVDPNIIPTGRDFVEGGCENSDWNLNFWGTNCSTPVSAQNRIPTCASATNNLSACPTEVIPCPDQIADSDLYVYGEEANQIGNHQAAVAYWTAMLEEFPESKYALSVTGWVKSLGITTYYGEDEYAHIVERLIDAAQASSGVEPHLSVYEFASAQCVEAYHGNRQGAIAVLDSMALVLKDPDDIKTVTYARLEMDTYPPQGQMNAMAAGDWLLAERNQRQAICRLQAAMAPGAARIAEEEVVEPQASVPSSFLLERPIPNPFNPRTRLALQVPAEGEVRVRVYNVQGQVVTTLREGRMRAGRHELVVEAGSWASGVYLARAEFQGQVQTQKLVLVK